MLYRLTLLLIITNSPLVPSAHLVDYSDSEDSENETTTATPQSKPSTSPNRSPRSRITSPLQKTPPSHLAITTKITPNKRIIKTQLQKAERKNRIAFSEKTANLLKEAMVLDPEHLEGKLYRQGILVFHERVLQRFAHNLLQYIEQERKNNSFTLEDEHCLLTRESEHALSSEIIINAILMGECSFQLGKNNQIELVIDAKVVCNSNDSIVKCILNDRTHVKLVFGSPRQGTTNKYPFVLYHAMFHKPYYSARYHQSSVDKAEAFLDTKLYEGKEILCFDLTCKKRAQLPLMNELFATITPTLLDSK